jgi:hypothetical protein
MTKATVVATIIMAMVINCQQISQLIKKALTRAFFIIKTDAIILQRTLLL